MDSLDKENPFFSFPLDEFMLFAQGLQLVRAEMPFKPKDLEPPEGIFNLYAVHYFNHRK